MIVRLVVVIVLAVDVLLAGRTGRAQSGGTARLTYAAPATCPAQHEFEAAVEMRGGRWDADGGVTALDVAIVPDEGGFRGTLRVAQSDGTEAVREVHADRCGDVVGGLAVISAITLGAPAKETPAPSSRPAPAPVRRPPPETRTRLRGSSFGRPETLAVERGTLRFDDARSYTLAAGAQLGLLPGIVVPRYDFVITRAGFVTPPSGPSLLSGPVLQVHWSWLGPATYHAADASVHMYGLAAGLSSCAAFAYDTHGLGLLACGTFDVGWLHYQPRDAAGNAWGEKNGGIGTAGLGLDASYALGSLVHLSLRGGAQLQFGTLSVARPDGSSIFEASNVGGYVQAGVGVHFQ